MKYLFAGERSVSTQPSDRKTSSTQQHRYTTGCNYTVFRSQCEIATNLVCIPSLLTT